jgi:hypothetical protein
VIISRSHHAVNNLECLNCFSFVLRGVIRSLQVWRSASVDSHTASRIIAQVQHRAQAPLATRNPSVVQRRLQLRACRNPQKHNCHNHLTICRPADFQTLHRRIFYFRESLGRMSICKSTEKVLPISLCISSFRSVDLLRLPVQPA